MRGVGRSIAKRLRSVWQRSRTLALYRPCCKLPLILSALISFLFLYQFHVMLVHSFNDSVTTCDALVLRGNVYRACRASAAADRGAAGQEEEGGGGDGAAAWPSPPTGTETPRRSRRRWPTPCWSMRRGWCGSRRSAACCHGARTCRPARE